MAELEGIAETLRRQRQDLDDLVDQTVSRKVDTEKLIEKIEELRARSERTQRMFDETQAHRAKE
jgi:predicted ATP-grasp superfamily ATP-dependent carboligase